jgi:hypothetical protein
MYSEVQKAKSPAISHTITWWEYIAVTLLLFYAAVSEELPKTAWVLAQQSPASIWITAHNSQIQSGYVLLMPFVLLILLIGTARTLSSLVPPEIPESGRIWHKMQYALHNVVQHHRRTLILIGVRFGVILLLTGTALNANYGYGGEANLVEGGAAVHHIESEAYTTDIPIALQATRIGGDISTSASAGPSTELTANQKPLHVSIGHPAFVKGFLLLQQGLDTSTQPKVLRLHYFIRGSSAKEQVVALNEGSIVNLGDGRTLQLVKLIPDSYLLDGELFQRSNEQVNSVVKFVYDVSGVKKNIYLFPLPEQSGTDASFQGPFDANQAILSDLGLYLRVDVEFAPQSQLRVKYQPGFWLVAVAEVLLGIAALSLFVSVFPIDVLKNLLRHGRESAGYTVLSIVLFAASIVLAPKAHISEQILASGLLVAYGIGGIAVVWKLSQLQRFQYYLNLMIFGLWTGNYIARWTALHHLPFSTPYEMLSLLLLMLLALSPYLKYVNFSLLRQAIYQGAIIAVLLSLTHLSQVAVELPPYLKSVPIELYLVLLFGVLALVLAWTASSLLVVPEEGGERISLIISSLLVFAILAESIWYQNLWGIVWRWDVKGVAELLLLLLLIGSQFVMQGQGRWKNTTIILASFGVSNVILLAVIGKL